METSNRLKRVLMLCYYYPPLSSAGTHRSVGFTQWLREHGWLVREISWQRPTLEKLFARIALELEADGARPAAEPQAPPAVASEGAACEGSA